MKPRRAAPADGQKSKGSIKMSDRGRRCGPGQGGSFGTGGGA